MNFFKFHGKDVGIDLGTSSILVVLKEKGIIFKDRYHILDQLDKKEPLAYYLEKIAGDRK